jgi:hypothetical protein
MPEWLSSAIPYVLAIATILAGGLDLYHRWDELKEKPLRKLVPILFVLIGLLTLVTLHHEDTEKHKADQDIQGLRTQVKLASQAEDTAIQNQKDNTATFLSQFQKLSGEVADLKTQVQTAALEKKLAIVQGELERTQKALAPAPKAALFFSFVPFPNPPRPQQATPVTDVKLPLAKDGSVHVTFTVLNQTNVDALDGGLILQICDECKFAKEPARFSKHEALLDTERQMDFDHIFGETAIFPIALDVIPPPPPSTGVTITILYRGRTCVLHTQGTMGTVHVIGP